MRRMGLVLLVPVVAAAAACGSAGGGPVSTGNPGKPAELQAAVSPSASPPATYDWKELFPATAPMPRDSAVTDYDAADSDVVVAAGEGSCSPGAVTYTDTWTWNGLTWTLAPDGNAPPVVGVPNAYDGATHTVVLIWVPGCGMLTTSQWNGTSWSATEPGATPNSNPAYPYPQGVMAYDPSTQTLVLWSPAAGYIPNAPTNASQDQASTWSWDGSTWQPLSPSTEPPASLGDPQMVWDPQVGKLVLYDAVSQAMWAWDGNQWSAVPVPSGPPSRTGASMIYDDALGEILLFGGLTASASPTPSPSPAATEPSGTPHNALSAWNGTTWTQLHPTTSPAPRFDAQMAYDAASGQVVLFGGAVNDIADVADTWVYAPAS